MGRGVEEGAEVLLAFAQGGLGLGLRGDVNEGRFEFFQPVALVAHGHCATTGEAFHRWLARGRPAYIVRAAASPEDVFARIHEAGGVASIAHPGLLGHDDWIREFQPAGLDAIEAYHTKHDAEQTRHYVALAARLGLAVSGGSDYHADDSHGAVTPGSVSLPREQFEALEARRRN